MKRQLLIIIAICVLIGAGCGYWMFNKPHENIEKAKVFQSYSAQELVNQFGEEYDKVDAHLNGKIVSIEGKVSDIEKTDDQFLVIIDQGGNFILLAYFKDNLSSLNGLAVGETIEFKGKYAGTIINDEDFMIPADIKIEECYLIS